MVNSAGTARLVTDATYDLVVDFRGDQGGKTDNIVHVQPGSVHTTKAARGRCAHVDLTSGSHNAEVFGFARVRFKDVLEDAEDSSP